MKQILYYKYIPKNADISDMHFSNGEFEVHLKTCIILLSYCSWSVQSYWLQL